jgi:type III secretion system low calcium response chaperone LcrH/SycD
MQADALKKALDKFDPSSPKSWAGMYDLIADYSKSAPSYKDLLDPPPGLLKNLSDMAGYLYNQQNYEVAKQIYELLYYYDAKNPIYVFSIGACEQALGDAQSALHHYLLSSSLDKKNPEPLYYAAELSLNLNQKEAAYQFFKQVIEVAKNDKKFEAIKSRSEAILLATKK